VLDHARELASNLRYGGRSELAGKEQLRRGRQTKQLATADIVCELAGESGVHSRSDGVE
jgi:hypothetical protein